MTTCTFTVRPISEHLGVELSDLVFEDVAGDEQFVDEVRLLLRRHRVVTIPGQRITPATMTAFMANFGPLLDIRRPGGDAVHVPGHDMIKVISNMTEPNGRPLGDGNSSAQVFHTDSTTWDAPPSEIAMYCRVTTESAPATKFADMIAVYESLPASLKATIDELRVIHHLYPRQIEVEIARNGPSMPLEERMVGHTHPLVRRHMATTLPILYLPTRRDSIVVGWTPEESRALLDDLWERVNATPFQTQVRLRPDDFVVWDNAALVHGREGWPETSDRLVWHVSAEGEIPTPRFGNRGFNVAGLAGDEVKALSSQAFRASEY